MRLICFVVALLATLSCQSQKYILVTVDGIPANGQSLLVMADHAGFSTTEDPEPIELPHPTAAAASLLLYMPSNFHGDVGISVGVFDLPSGQGCLLATGSGKENPFVGPGDSLRILLTPVSSPAACSGMRPLLLAAEPNLASSTGGQLVKLLGWGFGPGTTSTIGGQPAETTYISASELQITTPSVSVLGLSPVTINNTNSATTTRSDLLRIYAGTLAFIPFSGATGDYSGLSALNFGSYDSTGAMGYAIAFKTPRNLVRVNFGGVAATGSRKVADYSVGMNPSCLYSVDIDKDGDLDLLVANADGASVQIMKNDGMENLPVTSTLSLSPGLSAVVAGDIDDNGTIDIVAVNKTTTGLHILLGDGSGGYVDNGDGRGSGGPAPVSLALGDLNSDGLPDIVIANQGQGPVQGTVQIFFNDPLRKGHFRNGMFDVKFATGAGTSSVLLGDIDGNGFTDLMASVTDANKIAVYEFEKNAATPYYLDTEDKPKQLALVDLNGDGFRDLAVVCAGKSTVNVFINKLGAGFRDVQAQSFPSPCSAPAILGGQDLFDSGLAHLVVGSDGCLAALANQSK